MPDIIFSSYFFPEQNDSSQIERLTIGHVGRLLLHFAILVAQNLNCKK